MAQSAAKPASIDRCQRSQALSGRHLAAAVCAVAPRRSRALLRGLAFRALLVGDALRRHLCGRTRPRDLFVGLRARRHPGRRPAEGAGAAQFHPHGPAAATPRSAAPWRRSWRRPTSPISRRLIRKRTVRRARRAAAQRDLRLGRAGLDRSHQHDAGDAVRFSLGRPRRSSPGGRMSRSPMSIRPMRWCIRTTSASPSCMQDGRVFPQTVERARRRAADLRPDLDDGAFGSDAEHAGARIHRHDRAPDRRRQRHHAQFDERRADGAARRIRSSSSWCAAGAN